MKILAPLKQLHLADPELFQAVKTSLDHKAVSMSKEDVVILVKETLWALSVEISFGQSVAKGYADLIGEVSSENFYRYRELIRRFGHTIGIGVSSDNGADSFVMDRVLPAAFPRLEDQIVDI